MRFTKCNICGKDFDEFDEEQDFHIGTYIGYGSKYDTEKIDLDICNECMDKIIDDCKISPIVDK